MKGYNIVTLRYPPTPTPFSHTLPSSQHPSWKHGLPEDELVDAVQSNIDFLHGKAKRLAHRHKSRRRSVRIILERQADQGSTRASNGQTCQLMLKLSKQC